MSCPVLGKRRCPTLRRTLEIRPKTAPLATPLLFPISIKALPTDHALQKRPVFATGENAAS